MQLADRRYFQVIIFGWMVIYAWLLRSFVAEVMEGNFSSGLLIFGIVFVGMVAAMFCVVLVAMPLRIIMNTFIKAHRTPRRTETITLFLTLVGIWAYVFEAKRETEVLSPPADVTNLRAFSNVMPAPQKIELKHVNGMDYIVWVGDTAGPLALPSGPSCYVFNEKGGLLDWQAITGDGGTVDALLNSPGERHRLTLVDALKLTDSR